MARLRFNHVFALLMGLALAGSLFFPAQASRLSRGHVDNLFAPFTVPVRNVAAWLSRRVSSDEAPAGDPTARLTPTQLREQNQTLRAELAQATAELDRLRKLHAQFEQLGDAAAHARQFPVLFADSGNRDSVVIKATAADGVAPGMVVVTPMEAVGRVVNVGAGGAHVRLVTDRDSWMRVKFGRFDMRDGQRIFQLFRTERVPICQGAGDGRMLIQNLHLRDTEGVHLREGDVVLPDDESEWPAGLAGKPLGRVERITPQRKAPLFADVVVTPRVDLRRLANVMVVTSKP